MRTLRHVGQILDGKYKGSNVCYVSDGETEGFAIYQGVLRDKKWYERSDPCQILYAFSSDLVDHYVEVSSLDASESPATQKEIIKNGVNWGLFGVAMTAAIANTMGMYDFAVYLTDGSHFMLRLFYKDACATFKRVLYKYNNSPRVSEIQKNTTSPVRSNSSLPPSPLNNVSVYNRYKEANKLFASGNYSLASDIYYSLVEKHYGSFSSSEIAEIKEKIRKCYKQQKEMDSDY